MFDSDKFAFVDKKLKKDAKLGVIRCTGSVAPDNVNRISLAPKNSVEEPWRVCGAILDPNECYDNHKVRFETVRHVPDIFDSGDFMSIIDLKAAYHSLYVGAREIG